MNRSRSWLDRGGFGGERAQAELSSTTLTPISNKAPKANDADNGNPLLEVRRGMHEARDVQNIADILVDPEGALERRNQWKKTSHALLVGAILYVL